MGGAGFDGQDGDGVDGDEAVSVVDVETEVDPLVGADVRGGFVASVGVGVAESVEGPVGVGEVLDGAPVSRGWGLVLRPLSGRR